MAALSLQYLPLLILLLGCFIHNQTFTQEITSFNITKTLNSSSTAASNSSAAAKAGNNNNTATASSNSSTSAVGNSSAAGSSNSSAISGQETAASNSSSAAEGSSNNTEASNTPVNTSTSATSNTSTPAGNNTADNSAVDDNNISKSTPSIENGLNNGTMNDNGTETEGSRKGNTTDTTNSTSSVNATTELPTSGGNQTDVDETLNQKKPDINNGTTVDNGTAIGENSTDTTSNNGTVTGGNSTGTTVNNTEASTISPNTTVKTTVTTVPPDPCDIRPCSHICNTVNVTSYKCSCNQAYSLADDEHTCLDIDECQVSESLCSGATGMYCRNKPGGYDCICMAGYVQNENTCISAPKKFHSQFKVDSVVVDIQGNMTSLNWEAIDEKTENLQSAISVITQELKKLISNMKGYVGLKVTKLSKGSVLIDFDMYFTSDGPANSSEVKSALETSLTTQGCDLTNTSSACNFTSFQGLNTSIVLNAADPCALPQDNNCDTQSATCLSHPDGSFSCRCKPGYTRWPGTTFICADVDECVLNSHTCNNKTAHCKNNIGSYTCMCKNGYISDDKGQCKDACEMNPCEHDGRCIPAQGGYKCRCEGIWTGKDCDMEHEAALRYKMIAIIVGVLMGLLCLVLLVSFLMACCREPPKKVPDRQSQDVRMNEWEYERQSPHNVGYQAVQADGDDKDEASSFTGNSSRTGVTGKENPAYNPDQEMGSKTGNIAT